MRKLVKGGSSNERAFVLQENFMNHRKHSHTSGTIPLIVAAYLSLHISMLNRLSSGF